MLSEDSTPLYSFPEMEKLLSQIFELRHENLNLKFAVEELKLQLRLEEVI